ncbi:MAG: DegT/DnrJ/EryC1/StrS family aminotransferase [Nitrospiraceae bacterium]|nr:DegT/DnrJ/EryC1/StrS family aminotransferase [Nitrospiraceae bacterium]
MLPVPMLDLKRQLAGIRDEMIREVCEVIESGQYILGKKVAGFEGLAADYIGVRHAIGVASGTDALCLSLKALGTGPGDEVITTPFTFFSTIEAILFLGAKPVFADIDPETLNIDTSKIEEKITARTRAILPVHLFGCPADMATITEIAGRHGLKIVEDCAQSFGASLGGRKTGGFGDAGAFSFYPSKNLGAYGDGGLITTDSDRMAAEIRLLRNHGSAGGYIHASAGFNSRLDEIQAAVLLVKLKRLDGYNEQRRRKAALYDRFFSGAGAVKCPPSGEEGASLHVYHQYTIRHPRREEVMERLRAEHISSMVYYPVPLHLQPAVKFMGHGQGDFPCAEDACRGVLSLPIYPELEDETIERIAKIVSSV